MSFAAALNTEEKLLVKQIYGFSVSTYTPKFDGNKYIYDLDDDASPLHFETYLKVCRDYVSSNNPKLEKRFPLLIALQVKSGLVGQSTYYLTKPIFDEWDMRLRTHITYFELDLFLAHIRYAIRREAKMEFWVKVFDSFHQRQEDEIDKFQLQADILFDAFCWAKIVLGRMDGYPIDYPRHNSTTR